MADNYDIADRFRKVNEDDSGTSEAIAGPDDYVKKRRTHGVGRKGRNRLVMAEMKASMAMYWKDKLTYQEIAERVSEEFELDEDEWLTEKVISYHITTMIKTAQKQGQLHINEKTALVLARYDQLEAIITNAYFASMRSETINYDRQIKRARSKDREKQLEKQIKKERAQLKKENERRAESHQKLLPDPYDNPFGELEDLLVTTNEQINESIRTQETPSGDPRFLNMLIDINDKKAKLWQLLTQKDTAPETEFAQLPDEERESRLAAALHAVQTRVTGDKGSLALPSPLGGFKEGEEPTVAELVKHAAPEEKDPAPVEWEFD